jgi:hypothetical protein
MKSFFQTILSRIHCLYSSSDDGMVPGVITKLVYVAIPCLPSVGSSAGTRHWNETRNNQFIPETTLLSDAVAVRRNPIPQHCRLTVLSHCGLTFPHDVQRVPAVRSYHQHHRKVILHQLDLPSSARTSLSNEVETIGFSSRECFLHTVIEQSSVSVVRSSAITSEDYRHPGVITSAIKKLDCLHFLSFLRRELHLGTKLATIALLSK